MLKKRHRIIVPNINYYTVSLVPKFARIIHPNDSKMFLYDKNIKLAIVRITETLKKLFDIEENDFEEIKDKGNRITRGFENILKVLNLNRGI